ncbi:hypothetical protein C1645_744280 [Glomus cerebriforme]|uniref:Uncharacterized protein n=1 Tax=Glomus cerebriforme TaxID=658196 RepID=A0A397S5T9_9GLOM|nr:hypothetical protein C1645_744280 [Glomus cerebriforme]
MANAIFILLLTIFPYALFAQCCPKAGTFAIFPLTLPKQPFEVIVTEPLYFYNEPCKSDSKGPVAPKSNSPYPPGTYLLKGPPGFVTEGQCLPYSQGETSVWFLVNQGYFHPGGTNMLDSLPPNVRSPICYDHIRYKKSRDNFI